MSIHYNLSQERTSVSHVAVEMTDTCATEAYVSLKDWPTSGPTTTQGQRGLSPLSHGFLGHSCCLCWTFTAATRVDRQKESLFTLSLTWYMLPRLKMMQTENNRSVSGSSKRIGWDFCPLCHTQLVVSVADFIGVGYKSTETTKQSICQNIDQYRTQSHLHEKSD